MWKPSPLPISYFGAPSKPTTALKLNKTFKSGCPVDLKIEWLKIVQNQDPLKPLKPKFLSHQQTANPPHQKCPKSRVK